MDEAQEYRLSSHEAACLVAELLANQYSAVNPDQNQPRAYAMDLGDGNYRVLYVRGEQGLFLPEANGVFTRDRFLGAQEQPFLDRPPASPLGRIWFRHQRSVAPYLGGSESIGVEIQALDNGRCSVQIRSRSELSNRSRDRIDKIGYVLDGAERLKQGLQFYRAGDKKNALRVFKRLTELHDEGLSSVHDSLLSQAHALSGLILQRRERGEDARSELALARMRAPGSHELTLAWSRLMEDLGRPGDALTVLRKSAASTSPGSPQEWLFSRLAQAKERESLQANSYATCLSKAQTLLREGRHWAAKNWAERARDLRPRDVQAQRILARTLDGLGRFREARDMRLLSLHGGPPDAEFLLGLAANERQLGHPEIALRLILRHKEILDGSQLAKADAADLMQQLGIEESLRMIRSEGRHDQALPLILAWIRQQPGPRAELFSGILASESLERQRSQEGNRLLGAEALPDEDLPGASGLMPQRPTELVAPGK